jgi:hypothetical protein
MPIKRYVDRGVVFAPQALSAMGQALEETSQILGVSGDEKKRDSVAKFTFVLPSKTTASMRPGCVIRPWQRWEASHAAPVLKFLSLLTTPAPSERRRRVLEN